MVKVRFRGRIVELGDDPNKWDAEKAALDKKFKAEAEAAAAADPDSYPDPDSKIKLTDKQIEDRETRDIDIVGRVKAQENKRALIERNKKIDEMENTETAKSVTPDPIPPTEPIQTPVPVTEVKTTTVDGTTTSVTTTVEESETTSTVSTASTTTSTTATISKSTSTPEIIKTQKKLASSNKLSEKVHVATAQKFTKENHAEVLTKVAENLIPIESDIKAGGNQIISYEKDKHESIGAAINTFPCIRKDASGEFRPKSVSVEGKGAFVKYSPVSYTEEVENSKFPCGTYSINVANKYDLSVGAGGANISTAGNMRLGSKGRSIIAATEEMNISSGNGNVNIRAAHNISLKADSLNLESPDQVVVNSNLGVSKNAIINGCAFIDGEVYLNHVTCPAEVQYTGGGIGSFGQLMTTSGPTGSDKGAGGTSVIGYADVSFIKDLLTAILTDSDGDGHAYTWTGPDKIPVLVLPKDGTELVSTAGNGGVKINPTYSVFMYPHLHPFNNIPLSFTTGNEEMRARASILNSGAIGTASPINHGYKTPTA